MNPCPLLLCLQTTVFTTHFQFGDEGLEANACSPDETGSSESGGTPGGTIASDRLDLFCDLLRDVYGFSNDDVTRILKAFRHAGLL